ncbi:MAG: MarR family transcriptional regulator [Lachnospiraceae bacterium]|nr:MarR family transcriptional regulator [Lachnospiraceae bacterium]MDE6233537.1 MarR family transcriptional regulator [Lachnospiraceae bacterium]MDE6251064.1 MarR family transcriptional regulator [Lachnospiraceae bacterium]
MNSINTESILRSFWIDVFNEILKNEEQIVTKPFKGLSLREVHVIEAVCKADNKYGDNSATAIAKSLDVTGGTLTTAVTSLEKKGYLLRQRDEKDKRIVRIIPTDKGRKVQDYHMRYHKKMVDGIMYILNDEETAVLIKALGSLATFFKAKRTNHEITADDLLSELDKS